MAGSRANKTWTPEEDDFLRDNWGHLTVPGICEKLGRTKNAINVRVQRLGLSRYYDSGDYITLNQLYNAVVGHNVNSYQSKSWIANRGLPVHNKRRDKCTVKIIYLDEFWEWAEKNRSFIDFSKMEPLALGKEPDWVAEQRRKDYRAFALQRKDPWTPEEDSRLAMLLKQYKYGYAELSDMLHRSAGAIQRRCNTLGLKERPLRADPHGKESQWTEAHFQALAEGIRQGDSYTALGRAVGRSEKAVRGKVYAVYLTESLDKVRSMIGDGPFGFGAPEPTVRQGLCLTGRRTEVRRNLSALVGALKYRMNQLGYDPYWQRFMCMNWDDFGGCSAGCPDCDSCTEFLRIRPQYCARCGATFYEREDNRFCKSCRVARKKAAQRKWCAVHANAR